MEWNCGRVFVLLVLVVAKISSYERQTQSFVKINVSKINQNLSNETTGTVSGNDSSATTTVSTTISTTSTTAKMEVTTLSTTTTKPESTKPSTEKPFESPKEGRLAKKVPTGYYCKCDLKVNICDVNCCCDIDCTTEVLKTFDCNEELLDTSEYNNLGGLQSCEVQGGLLCLVGETVHEKNGAFYDPSLKNLMKRHRWKDTFPLNKVPKDGSPSAYRVNDPLQLYNETNETVDPFTLPYSLTNSDCQLRQPIRFLRDQSTECLRSLESLELFTSDLLEQQSNVRYLRQPRAQAMEHCMEQDCMNSTTQFCNLLGQNCQISNKTENYEHDGEWYCPELRITLFHNYTRLEGVEMSFLCGLLHFSGQDTDSVWQKISVEFKRKDEEKYSRKLSGNLGYLKGKPVIVSAARIPENDTAEDRRSKKYMLNYFTNETRNPDDTFRLKLPKSRGNRCVLNDNVYYDILFGENSWNRCYFSPQWNVTYESNFTTVCNRLQESIFNLLLHNISPLLQTDSYESMNLYLSKYGNPINQSSEWIPTIPLNVVNEKLTASWPSSTGGQETGTFFSCNSMVINVNYHFYYARITVRNVPRQQVLQETEIIFGPRVDLQFALDEEIRVPINTQVQFFDLTSSNGGVGIWCRVISNLLAMLVGLVLVTS
ncbi:tectonic [Topomyia yanbarensis]|uniref:tectonic n=1 Tax=Topomyia yanbarensis TaxID=2498891 RepID=UPI00273B6972|nr:tectonic [Topomyia yanbarensis]